MPEERFNVLNKEFSDLIAWRDIIRPTSSIIVATNGCFDILHVGHIRMLEEARRLGDYLVVGLNGDESVRKLKGKGRPINSQQHRKEILRSLRSVDVVTIFDGITAEQFLKCLRPDVYVKSGDYTMDTLDKGEKELLLSMGTQIHFAPYVQGVSTTTILGKMNGQ